MLKNRTRRAALIGAAALLAGACGGDDNTTGTGATAAAVEDSAGGGDRAENGADDAGDGVEDEGLARARAIAEAALVPPTEIVPTIPLTSVPEKRTVAWLECELPTCQEITPGVESAVAALGWDLLKIVNQSFNPGPAIQQAIDSGADYIALTGSPRALFEEQLAAANAAGIPIMQCYNVDEPDIDAGLYMQCADGPATEGSGAMVANWAIADGNGEAHTLFVTIRDFSILVAVEDGARSAYEENCPTCTFEVLNFSIDQFASGSIPGAIVSALQNNPQLNYIYFSFGDLPLGVTAALSEAGLLDSVKQVGIQSSLGVGLTEVADGTHRAWSAAAKLVPGYLMVDAMARHAVGMENPQEREAARLPEYMIADAEQAARYTDTGWPGPEGFEDQFKALWGVD